MRNINLATIILLMTFTLGNMECTAKNKKDIGIQLWSVREDIRKDLPKTIKALGQMGYTFVEAAGYNDGQFYNLEPLAFKALLNENNLGFLSSHAGIALPDSSAWKSTMQWWDKAIEAHLQAGVKYIVQPSLHTKKVKGLEELKRFCNYFNAIGEKCQAQGIKFGFHNHDYEFKELEGQVIYDFILKNTSPDKVFFQMDLYWVMMGGKNPLDYFKNYPGRFELWHVKDEKELGESGKMAFESLFAEVQQSGMKHIIVEVERYNYAPLKSIEISLDFLLEADYVK